MIPQEKKGVWQTVDEVLKEQIEKTADMQLDGKMHWMFTHEPSFHECFVDWVKNRVEFISESRNMEYNSKDIEQAIGIEANTLDQDLSHPISHEDSKAIYETVKMFRNNDFVNAENYPWIIQPSEDPKYPYDWVLWNDQYPIVQYSSKNKSIDPCLEIGIENYNEICTVIHSAAHKKNGQYIFSAADKEKVKNSGRV